MLIRTVKMVMILKQKHNMGNGPNQKAIKSMQTDGAYPLFLFLNCYGTGATKVFVFPLPPWINTHTSNCLTMQARLIIFVTSTYSDLTLPTKLVNRRRLPDPCIWKLDDYRPTSLNDICQVSNFRLV